MKRAQCLICAIFIGPIYTYGVVVVPSGCPVIKRGEIGPQSISILSTGKVPVLNKVIEAVSICMQYSIYNPWK